MKHSKSACTPLMLVVAGLAPGAAQAATVRAVSAAKSMVALDIEEGETVAKGDSYCIFAGKKKIDCGKVTKIKGNVAVIALANATKLAGIKKGMPAKNSGAAAGAAAGADTAAGDATAATDDLKAGGKSGSSAKGGGKRVGWRIWLLADPALASPFTYKPINYKAPDGTATPTTLWSPGKPSALALVSFGGQLGIPIGKKAVNLGLRTRTFTASTVDTDYTVQVLNPYANTAVKASAFGAWADYLLVHAAMSPSVFFNFLPGLDLDASTVSVTATKKNDGAADSGSIVSATSKLMVVSLRLGANFDIFFGKSFGLTIGATGMIPLVPLGGSLTADFPTGEDRGLADPTADLKSALGHKKNTFALEALASIFVAF